MPTIIVSRPFSLRLSQAHKRRDFGLGEHEISDVELTHWFLRACLTEGRAVLKAEPLPDTAPDTMRDAPAVRADYTEAELRRLRRADLEDVADALGLSWRNPYPPNKDALVDLILESREEDGPQ